MIQPNQTPPKPAVDGGGGEEGAASIFLSKEMLGGRPVKEGDTLTLTVKSIDPETGEAEAALAEGGETTENTGLGEQGFDSAMPPEEG